MKFRKCLHCLCWILIQITSFASSQFRIEWETANKSTCDTFCQNNSVCSYDSGLKYSFGERNPKLNVNAACTFLKDGYNYYNGTELLNHLGDNAVLAVVGDSIMRSLFVSMLSFLGPEYEDWFKNLQLMSGNWSAPGRDKLDHTFMCSEPLSRRNITLAFLWRPMYGHTVSRVPWVLPSMPGKEGRCVWWENGNGVRHCDSSHESGSHERWRCGDILDTIQRPGKPKRSFIVLSSGGAHNAVEEAQKARSVASNQTLYLAHSEKRFMDATIGMEHTKSHWDVITKQGGRNIFLLPTKIDFGYPRTVGWPHSSAVMMENMLEYHVRQALRRRSNLTCENGFEILETSTVFAGPSAPGTVGDGMHYEFITNMALIQLITHRLVRFNSSDWRSDDAGWNQTSSHLDKAC